MAFLNMKNVQRTLMTVAIAGGLICADFPAMASLDSVERDALRQQLSSNPSFLLPIGTNPEDIIDGRCILWGDIAYMLSPTMTLPETQKFTDTLPPLSGRRYRTSRFWLKTATDGLVNVPGERITLTWSFVPDGTLILNPRTDQMEESELFQRMSVASTLFSVWQDRFRRSFDDIGDLVGIDYVEVSDDGAPQPAPGVEGVRGDVRISMIRVDEDGLLAFNYLPDAAFRLGTSTEGWGGDMVFNGNEMGFFNNSQGQHRRLRHVIMHEHGHGLGFLHVDPINFTKLMEATVGSGLNAPQEDDIRGFQSVYGDWLEVNDSAATATPLGALPVSPGEPPLVLNNLAIERAGAQDYFQVSVPGPSILSVKAAPVGFTYLEGPENGPVNPINSLAIHNLIVDVIEENGVSIMTTLNETGAGEEESGEIPLPGAGDYYVRVRSSSTSTQSQRYTLTLSRSVVPPDATESMIVY